MAEELFLPIFRTPVSDHSKEELNKLNSNGMRGSLGAELRAPSPDLQWEAEQIAKSYGIYLEFNRAKSGEEKDWSYMVRIGIPGGGILDVNQWRIFDDLADRFTRGPANEPSLRLTNRQNIQFHWVKKIDVVPLVKTLAQSGLYSLNGCGDNVRNVMGCPLSRYSTSFDAIKWAHQAADYFRLPTQPFIEIFEIDRTVIRSPDDKVGSFSYGPQLLNRKFKIAFSSVHQNENGQWTLDNCVELKTNDMGVAPVFENGRIQGFQIYVGGGQGERNGKPTVASFGLPIGMIKEDQLLKVMSAVVSTHQEWGDRKNRHWARMKYLVHSQGRDWVRAEVESRCGFRLEDPIDRLDIGPRHLHHGWHYQPSNQKWSYGVYVENGRLHDLPNLAPVKKMVRTLMEEFRLPLSITPNQDLIFSDIPTEMKENFESRLKSFSHEKRAGGDASTLRKHSGACVGRDTCRLAYTDSEKFEPQLLDELEKMGWGHLKESIGITGCERQCFRPGTKTIGLVGSGMNRYQFRILGTEDGRHLGTTLNSEDGKFTYLGSVPREKVAVVIDAIFRFHRDQHSKGEDVGYFLRRVGIKATIEFLKADSITAPLMTTPLKAQPRL